ncbi:hypothetical protein OROMI_017251 [Orobanche minor]
MYIAQGEIKREGAGRGNWGTQADELVQVTEEVVNEGEKTWDANLRRSPQERRMLQQMGTRKPLQMKLKRCLKIREKALALVKNDLVPHGGEGEDENGTKKQF